MAAARVSAVTFGYFWDECDDQLSFWRCPDLQILRKQSDLRGLFSFWVLVLLLTYHSFSLILLFIVLVKNDREDNMRLGTKRLGRYGPLTDNPRYMETDGFMNTRAWLAF